MGMRAAVHADFDKAPPLSEDWLKHARGQWLRERVVLPHIGVLTPPCSHQVYASAFGTWAQSRCLWSCACEFSARLASRSLLHRVKSPRVACTLCLFRFSRLIDFKTRRGTQSEREGACATITDQGSRSTVGCVSSF